MFVDPKQQAQNNLINKIKQYLAGDDAQKPSQNEISQGMFIHCLVVALLQMQIIKVEQEKLTNDQLNERLENLEKRLMDFKNHHRHEELDFEDEDEIRAQMLREFAKLLDPDTLEKPDQDYEQLTHIVERTANLLHDDKTFRANTDDPDPGRIGPLQKQNWPPRPALKKIPKTNQDN
jgi:hypothetical protein